MSAFDKLMAIRGLPLPEKDEVQHHRIGPCSEHTFPTGGNSIGGDCWHWGCGQ